ncbi:hypothetical protein [Micrococcus sp. IITD107]|uniref:hypothetical protein n=1 Tax=Micrococcus sp. IITD107 TaxID=3342790 RepID=UPI0035BAC9C7
MSSEIPEHLLGTEQHRQARDLSEYLVHMTTTPEALGHIITTGHIEARNRFGIGRGIDHVKHKHASACFTEMPVSELDRLRDRNKPWGIAFKREFVLERGGQRVWYLEVDKPPYQALHGMKERAIRLAQWESSIWDVTPFVDQSKPGTYAFDWEREWRVVGGLKFEPKDIALVIGLEGVQSLIQEDFTIGAPYYDPRDQAYYWESGSIPEVGANMDALLQKFHENFMSPEDAGLLRDPDSRSGDGYWWEGCASRYETEDAVGLLSPDAPEGVRDALRDHLNQVSFAWADRYEDDTEEPE